MDIVAVGLAYTAATSVGWAAFDASRKSLASSFEPMALVALLMFAQVPAFAIWAAAAGAAGPSPGYGVPALCSILINVVANFAFLRAMQLSPLSVTIPYLALSPVFAVIAGIPILGEAPSALQLLGIVIIVVGAFALNAGPDTRSPRALYEALVRERGCVLMIAVAALWAVSGTFDKAAVAHSSAPIHALVQCAGIGVCVTLWLASQRRLGELRTLNGRGVAFSIAIVGAVAALGFQLMAYRVMMVSVVEAIKRAIGMVLALANGRIFFGEHISVGKVAGVVFMCGGVALIVL